MQSLPDLGSCQPDVRPGAPGRAEHRLPRCRPHSVRLAHPRALSRTTHPFPRSTRARRAALWAQGARLAAGTQHVGSVVRAGGHSAASGRGSRNHAGTSPAGRERLPGHLGAGAGGASRRGRRGDRAGSRPPAPQTPVSGARRTAEQLSGVPTRLVSCRLRWSRILTHLEGAPRSRCYPGYIPRANCPPHASHTFLTDLSVQSCISSSHCLHLLFC